MGPRTAKESRWPHVRSTSDRPAELIGANKIAPVTTGLQLFNAATWIARPYNMRAAQAYQSGQCFRSKAASDSDLIRHRFRRKTVWSLNGSVIALVG